MKVIYVSNLNNIKENAISDADNVYYIVYKFGIEDSDSIIKNYCNPINSFYTPSYFNISLSSLK